jgi:predicted amidohydrolase YtcJ
VDADIVIVNGRIFRGFAPGEQPPTGSAEGPRPPDAPTAVAISGGRVAWVGHDAEARRAWRGPRTQLIDAGGGLVLTGFDDAHFHLVEGARSLDQIDLSGSRDLAEIQDRVRKAAAANPGDGWLVGYGWVYGNAPGGLPTAEALDAAVADRPVYLRCFDGHTGWVNHAGMRAAGIDRDTSDPAHGSVVRDAVGDPTGALKEDATKLVERHLPTPSLDADLASLRRAIGALHAAGVTSVQDAWADRRAFEACRRLLDRDELRLRVRLALPMMPHDSPAAWSERLAEHEALAAAHRDGPWLTAGILKAFADGVVESRTAALLAPYEEDVATGHPNWRPEQLDAHVAEASRRGWQVEIHAIGDGAVRMALDSFERAAAPERRHRVEHIEMIDAADIGRFARLNVAASMQPLHADPAPNHADIWATNIGPERATRGWAWGSIARAGGRLAFGSDWPVVTFDPIRGLQSAVNRQTADGLPAGGWHPAERLPLPDALAAWTAGSAWAAHAESKRGSIEPGLEADLVILDRDLLEAGASAIIGTGVRLTVVGGRIVHRREDAS